MNCALFGKQDRETILRLSSTCPVEKHLIDQLKLIRGQKKTIVKDLLLFKRNVIWHIFGHIISLLSF